MRKLANLRQHLLDSPLRLKGTNLLTFAEQGSLEYHRNGTDDSFEIRYNANVVITDFAGAFTALSFCLLRWMSEHQFDLEPDAIDFHVDILDSKKSDVSFKLPLTEFVAATDVAGGTELNTHPMPDALDFGMYYD